MRAGAPKRRLWGLPVLPAGPDSASLVIRRGPIQSEHMVQRFARLDPARGRPGSGLGLPLVAAAAHYHHGDLASGDNGPGRPVTMRLRRHG